MLPKPNDQLHGFTPGELNTHFAGVSVSHSKREADMDEFLSNASDDGFTFRELTFSDVVLAVAHFSSQAKGENSIPQSVIAKSLPLIGHHLTALFNTLLSSGIFPGARKRAHLVPLKKKAISSATSDFHLIAFLSFLSKVLQKIVLEQILELLLEENPRSSPNRFR